jgi:hypothetical protein
MTTDRRERLIILSKGKASAAERRFGSRIKFLPSIDGMICQLSEEESDCFDRRKDAVDAARAFKQEAKSRLCDEYGEGI